MTDESGQTAGETPERDDASEARAAGGEAGGEQVPSDGADRASAEGAAQAVPDDEAQAAVEAAKEAVAGVNEAAGETPEPGAASGEAESALAAARAAVGEVQESVQRAAVSGAAPEPFVPAEFGSAEGEPSGTDIDLLGDVELDVKIELGRTRLLVEDVLNLGTGAVVELEKLAGDPVDVFVNDRHVAKGEVLVLNDQFSIRINEIIDPMATQSPTGRAPAGVDGDGSEDEG